MLRARPVVPALLVFACGDTRAPEPAAGDTSGLSSPATSDAPDDDEDDVDEDESSDDSNPASSGDTTGDDTDAETTDSGDAETTGAPPHDGPTGTFDLGDIQARVFVPETVHTLGHSVAVIHAFHGAGDNENNFLNVILGGGSWPQIATDDGVIIVAYRGTAGGQSIWEYPIEIPGWPLTVGTGDIDRVVAVDDWLRSQYDIDEDRIYAIGFSMGATMATEVALALDDRFAAFMATSQGTPVSDYSALAPASGYRVAGLFHGDPQDPVYASVPYTADLLQSNGHDITVNEQPGTGHVGAWMESTIYDPGPSEVWAWLSSHTR